MQVGGLTYAHLPPGTETLSHTDVVALLAFCKPLVKLRLQVRFHLQNQFGKLNRFRQLHRYAESTNAVVRLNDDDVGVRVNLGFQLAVDELYFLC